MRTPREARLSALTRGAAACETYDPTRGNITIKALRFFSSALLFLTLSLTITWAQADKEQGTELLYGAPADAFINTFPVLTIDPHNGSFTDFFNVTAPPPFVCSGGSEEIGSRFLYVTIPPGSCENQIGEIVGYTLDPKTGVPTPMKGSPFKLGKNVSPNGMAKVPNSNILYVADAAGFIDAFAVDKKTGVPKRIKGSPFPTGATVYELAVDPAGRFLYASNYDPPGSVFAFTIAPTGALTPVSGSPFRIPGPKDSNYQPVGILATGHYVYTALVTNQIAAFSIGQKTGRLTRIKGSPFASGNGPTFLTQTGKFLYALNELDGSVSGYSIDIRTGALNSVPGSPFGSNGFELIVDRTGKYLYVSTHRGVQGYDIDPETGTLTQGEGFHGNDGGLWLTTVQLPKP